MKMASVELASGGKPSDKKVLRLICKIGAGTQFQMGEENAFLFDALHKHVIYILCRSVLRIYTSDNRRGLAV